MKILQILPELNIGGVERGVLDLSKALVAQGHESYVISNGGKLEASLIASGGKHISMPIHKKRFKTLKLSDDLYHVMVDTSLLRVSFLKSLPCGGHRMNLLLMPRWMIFLNTSKTLMDTTTWTVLSLRLGPSFRPLGWDLSAMLC